MSAILNGNKNLHYKWIDISKRVLPDTDATASQRGSRHTRTCMHTQHTHIRARTQHHKKYFDTSKKYKIQYSELPYGERAHVRAYSRARTHARDTQTRKPINNLKNVFMYTSRHGRHQRVVRAYGKRTHVTSMSSGGNGRNLFINTMLGVIVIKI